MRVIAVVITYEPELEKLGRLLDAVIPQVDTLVVVDNGSSVDLASFIEMNYASVVQLIKLGINKGIAYAQNRGLEWAKNKEARYVLLLDQDSVPGAEMVQTLLATLLLTSNAGAVGPRYLDVRQENPPPFIQVRGLRLIRCSCIGQNSVVPVDYLIASGCLIPMAVIDRVGGMREDLFIDYVDIEWGLRARHLGFQSYGVCEAKMTHSLGDEPSRFFGRVVPVRSPLRHYYMVRNGFLLYREAWISNNWKVVDGWRLLLKYVFYSLFAKPRMMHWRMMTIGLWHGLRGRGGKFDEGTS
jgi:rhamnosyltransferase